MRIGIDLGGTKTEGIVMTDDGAILHRLRRPTPAAQGYQAILVNIAGLVSELEQHAGRPCPVGIGTPGAISAVTGRMKNSNTTCLNDQPLLDDLRAVLNRPVRIANDANCFALSEARDGAAAGAPVVFGVIMGTGVGGGIVINGELIEGLQHIAGEWGHNTLEPEGPPCYCGRRGCVETLISGPGLVQDFQRHGGHVGCDARQVIELAGRGNALAEVALHRLIDRFGRALATVINILDPHVIVLGGGLSNVAQLYNAGKVAVARHVFNDELRTRIVCNQHGDSSGVRGAAQLWRVDEVHG